MFLSPDYGTPRVCPLCGGTKIDVQTQDPIRYEVRPGFVIDIDAGAERQPGLPVDTFCDLINKAEDGSLSATQVIAIGSALDKLPLQVLQVCQGCGAEFRAPIV